MLSVINSSIVENAVNPRLMLLMRIILIAICCQWIQIYKNQMIFTTFVAGKAVNDVVLKQCFALSFVLII